MFIFSTKSSETIFTTNCLVSQMFRSVSFCSPSLPRTIGEKQITGGFALTAVKKLKGARFRMPPLLNVDTNAIGLGTITPTINLYTLAGPASDGTIVMEQA